MADQKLTELTALTVPADTDIIYIVDDPGGTPLSRKITRADFLSGADLPGGLLVNGSADAVQFTVQGHSTQTSNIFLIEKSDSTDLITVDNSGTITIAGDINHDGSNAGFYGVAPAAQPAHIVDADGTLADVTSKFNTLLAQMATLGLQAAS